MEYDGQNTVVQIGIDFSYVDVRRQRMRDFVNRSLAGQDGTRAGFAAAEGHTLAEDRKASYLIGTTQCISALERESHFRA